MDYVTPVAATFGVFAAFVVVFALRYVVLLRRAALRKRSSAALATDASDDLDSAGKPPFSAGGTTFASDPLSPVSAAGTGNLFAPAPYQHAVSRSPAYPREPRAWLQAPTGPAAPWIAAVGKSFWGRWHGQVEQSAAGAEDAMAAEAVAALGDVNLHDSEGGGGDLFDVDVADVAEEGAATRPQTRLPLDCPIYAEP